MKTTILSLLATLALMGQASAIILINEIHKRTPATSDTDVDADLSDDENYEFVELKGTPNEYCTHNGLADGIPLTLIFIKTDAPKNDLPKNLGRVQEAWKLVIVGENGAPDVPMKVGSNGLLLLGNKYNIPAEAPWQGFKNTATTSEDPPKCKSEDLDDGDGLSALLVVGYTFPVSTETEPDPTPAEPNRIKNLDPDFDVDNNEVLDWKQTPVPTQVVSPRTGQLVNGLSAAPWTRYSVAQEYVDSIGYNGGNSNVIYTTYAAATLTVGDIKGVGSSLNNVSDPYNISRYGNASAAAGSTNPNNGNGWYAGVLAGTEPEGTSYKTLIGASGERWNRNTTGTMLTSSVWGQATPGQANLTSNVVPVFRISEVNLKPRVSTGLDPVTDLPNDGNYEYIEIANVATSADKSASLDGYSLVLLNSAGLVEEHWNLSKYATGYNGLLLLGDKYPEGYCPFSKIVDPQTTFGDPSAPNYAAGAAIKFTSLSQGDIGADNGFTLYLVKTSTLNKTAANGTQTDADTNSDNLADAAFTTVLGTVSDSLSSAGLAAGVKVTGQLGLSAVKVDLTVGGKFLNPDNFSRKVTSAVGGFVTTVDAASWTCGRLGARSENAVMYLTGHHPEALANGLRAGASPGKLTPFNSPAPPAVGSLLLNEVHVNPGGPVDGFEYVEVKSLNPFQTMANTWLVIVDTGTNLGLVRTVVDLRNQNTGSNRLALFGDGFEEVSTAMTAFAARQTVRDDPPNFNTSGVADAAFNLGSNNISNDGAAIFLVTYVPVSPATPSTPPTTPGTDLDTNDDGIFTAPWTTTLDAVATGVSFGDAVKAGNHTLPVANVHSISRLGTNVTPKSADAWSGGELSQGAIDTTLTYGSQYFGPFQGFASPGRINPNGPSVAEANVLLNEIHLNPPGGDNNKEFIEISASNNAATSLNGYSLLFIDNYDDDTFADIALDPTKKIEDGTIEKIIDLDGYSTGGNGLALIGTNYNNVMPWVAPNGPAAGTSIIAPEELNPDDIGRFTDNGASCVILVKNLRGRVGDDLDQLSNAAVAKTLLDDQKFDLPVKWDALVDGVSIKSYVPDDPDTATIIETSVKGVVFDGTADLTTAPDPVVLNSPNNYTPDSVARYSNASTITKASWYGGDISGTMGTSLNYDTIQKFATSPTVLKATPGQPNALAVTDDSDFDGDTVPYLVELALGMNPDLADIQKLPQPGYSVVSGVSQPTFVLTRPLSTPGIYTKVEASKNLTAWNLVVPTTPAISVNQGDGTKIETWVIDPDFLPLVAPGKRVFFRLKVSRTPL